MSRLLLISLLALSVLLAGCGEVFFGFVFNPGNPVRVTGTISAVQLGFINDGHGTSVTVTAVTFFNAGTSSTVHFCGDQRNLFPINQFVRADFNSGINCSTLIAVVVVQG